VRLRNRAVSDRPAWAAAVLLEEEWGARRVVVIMVVVVVVRRTVWAVDPVVVDPEWDAVAALLMEWAEEVEAPA
jgi:hypothetical protein